MEELNNLCTSDDLSLIALREKIGQLSTGNVTQETYNKHPFLHMMCKNKNVTLEMVEYVLESFPGIASYQTNTFDWRDNIDDAKTASYALHCACYNKDCPGSVIKLLLEEFRAAINWLSNMLGGVHEWNIKGLPLHYYLARTSNIDIDIVKLLVEAYPQSLMYADETWPCYPIHAAVYDSNPDDLQKVVEYLIEFNPASLRVLDGEGSTPLHLACESKSVNLSLVQLLFNSWPEAIRISGPDGRFPIHELCHNHGIEDTTAISVLRFMLDIDQTIARERNGSGYLPIDYAIEGNSFEFCKVLIDEYPESIRIINGSGYSPIHNACGYGHRVDIVDTIQYMLELDPDLINARDSEGLLPIHHAAKRGKAKTIEVLLKHDPDAASKVTENNQLRQLPLHIACGCHYGGEEYLDTVKGLYDAYPQAIHIRNNNGQGQVPLEIARGKLFTSIVSFLETQNVYSQKAKDSTAMHTLDSNGWLPLHHAIKDNAPLGSIKLLVKGNPSAIRTVDGNLAFPLHIACQFSTVKVVRHLVELDSRIPVGRLDMNNDSVLHYACRGGNLGVIRYLVNSHGSLVSNTNADNKLPFHLLIECEDEHVRESLDFTEACFQLLRSHPETVSMMQIVRKRRRD